MLSGPPSPPRTPSLTGPSPVKFNDALNEHFDEQARVQLTLTPSFYFGVPRLLNALRVPVEITPTPAGKDRA